MARTSLIERLARVESLQRPHSEIVSAYDLTQEEALYLKRLRDKRRALRDNAH